MLDGSATMEPQSIQLGEEGTKYNKLLPLLHRLQDRRKLDHDEQCYKGGYH